MIFRCRWVSIAVAVAVPMFAQGHSIGNELGGGTSQASPTNPATNFASDQLNGTANFSDALSMRLNLGLTHDFPVPKQGHALFPEESGSNILFTALALNWAINDHYEIGAEFDYSPDSVQYSDTALSFQPASASASTVSGEALLRSMNNSIGGVLTFDANTAGDSNFESDVNASAAISQFNTHQSLPRIVSGGKTYTAQDLKSSCGKGKTSPSICAAYGHAIRGDSAELTQLRLFAGFTETFSGNTDATLSGAYYLYDGDPTQIGYFSGVSAGRFAGGGSIGNGLPLLPLVYSVRPEVAHRFGPVMVDLWYQFGQYYGADGYGHTVGGKVQWKISKAWRVYVSGTAQDDIGPPDPSAIPPSTTSTSTYSFTVAAGFKYRW